MKKINVILIYGGISPEHDVSLLSTHSILQNIDFQKYHITLIKITRDGHWISQPDIIARDFPQLRQPLSNFHFLGTDIWNQLTLPRSFEADVVFPVLHGNGGEDGTLQGCMALWNLPCVGSNCAASAVCMDKGLTKKILAYHNLPIVPFIEISQHQMQQPSFSPNLPFAFPVFVKPADSGSTVGVHKVAHQHDLVSALEAAFAVSRKALVEPAIIGKEVEVAVLGNADPKASIPGEIIPSHEFYDYEDKYLLGQAQLLIPAQLEPDTIQNLQKISQDAFTVLQCSGLARIDFFVTRQQEIFINEVNTLPGFTTISMYPKLWQAMGYRYSQLIDELIQLALQQASYG